MEIIARLKIKDVELGDGRSSNDVSEEWIEAVKHFGPFKKGEVVEDLGHNCHDSDYKRAGLIYVNGEGWVLISEK